MADTTEKTPQEQHNDIIVDSDVSFKIDPTTRAVTGDQKKISLMQYDHNSERFSFSVPRFIEGHDMTNCTIRIHYCNIDAQTRARFNGLYEVTDAGVDPEYAEKPEGEQQIKFSWLISQNATQHAGTLNFLIEFTCLTIDENGESEVYYRWNTNINKEISITIGMNNNDSIDESYADLITEWEAMIKKHLEDCDKRLEDGVERILNGEYQISLNTITEINENKNVSIWIGTQAEYDALDTLNENVHYIIKENSGANKAIAALNNDLNTEKGKITQIQSDLNTEKDNITQIQSDLNTEKGKITQIQSDLNTEKEKISELRENIDSIEDLKTQMISSEGVSVYELLDESYIGTTLDSSSKIRFKYDSNPITGNDAYLMTFEDSETLDKYYLLEDRGDIILVHGSSREYYATIYSNYTWAVEDDMEWLVHLLTTYVITEFNTNIQWNNWILYETAIRTEETGYLKKKNGNYFIPKTPSVSTVYRDYVMSPDGALRDYILLHSFDIPNGKTVDDIIAISFQSTTPSGLMFNGVRCYGDTYHFQSVGNSRDSNDDDVIEIYKVDFALRRTITGDIAIVDPYTCSYKIPCITTSSPSFTWDYDIGVGMQNVLVYFK